MKLRLTTSRVRRFARRLVLTSTLNAQPRPTRVFERYLSMLPELLSSLEAAARAATGPSVLFCKGDDTLEHKHAWFGSIQL